ncbi:MAG: lytic transglycosylase domain-containing protein [Trichlorobacter sp.]|nr:lytic transglycosylase domain-containing protein [Trichlorobacter sp.]
MRFSSKSLKGLVLGAVAGMILFCSPSASNAFCFNEAAKRYGISPRILWAIAKVESGGNPRAINYNKNGTYDYGLMQINSIHKPELERVGIKWESLADPCTSVYVAAWLLSQHVQQYGYTWDAVGAYHSKTPSKRKRYAALVGGQLKAHGGF